MFKLKQKFLEKIKKETDEFTTNSSSLMVDLVLKKDLFKKSRDYKTVVNDKFFIYLENYVTVCEYLYKDFNVAVATFNNEKTELINELDLKQKVKKVLKQYPTNKVRLMDNLKVNKQIKKWWILSTILQNYPDALNMLKLKSNCIQYKDLNLDEELAKVETHKYLIEDFSILQNG